MKTPGRIIQITGLPRSGTAFMAAVMMLHPDCNVFHECIADGPGWRERLAESCERWPITADCGTYQYMPGATLRYSDKIFLSRPHRESADACGRFMDIPPDYAVSSRLVGIASDWIELFEVRSFQFQDLFTVETIREIWNYLKLGQFPENKVAQLVRMRICRNDPELFSKENAAVSAHELL